MDIRIFEYSIMKIWFNTSAVIPIYNTHYDILIIFMYLIKFNKKIIIIKGRWRGVAVLVLVLVDMHVGWLQVVGDRKGSSWHVLWS